MADYIVHKAVELSALSAKNREAIKHRSHVLSPKYDGCHAIFLFDNGKFLATKSRTNEHVFSMPHIGQSLLDHYPFLQCGKHAIMGEAWIPGREFSDISGIFRRQSPQPELGFVPFDTVRWRYDYTEDGRPVLGQYFDGVELQEQRDYLERLHTLIGERREAPSLVHIPRFLVLDGADAWALAEEEARRLKKLGGYDGAVLADAHGRYVVGAGKGGEFIKVKPLLSVSLKVTGIACDKGERTGKNTMALICDLDGKAQKVSTGLTQAEVDEYTEFPHNIIGEVIEVEAMGYTVTGLLREPRYRGIRTDVI